MDQVRTDKKHPWVNTCEYIILHHTATWLWSKEWLLNALQDPNYPASYHYLVDEHWGITKINKDNDILRHCWVSERDWKEDMNRYSIGVEVIWPWFTEEQHIACQQLIIQLMQDHQISDSNVLRHWHIAPDRKRDIAPEFYEPRYWWWKEYTKFLSYLAWTMQFYEKIRNDENGNTEKEERVFQDPQWAVERISNLKPAEQISETMYLMWVLIERISRKIDDLHSNK